MPNKLQSVTIWCNNKLAGYNYEHKMWFKGKLTQLQESCFEANSVGWMIKEKIP